MTTDSQSPFTIEAMRFQQAQQLHDSVVTSCQMVAALIGYIAVLLVVAGDWQLAIAWLLATLSMVAVTYFYSSSRSAITPENYERYLSSHIWISCATGLVWSTFACLQLDGSSYFSMFIAMNIATSITLGGMFPSSAYRATYLGLLTCCVVPLTVYWFFAVPGQAMYLGGGFVAFYSFGLIASARTELNMRDIVLARQERVLTEQLQAKNQVIERSAAEKSGFMMATVHDFSQPLHAQGYFIHALRNLLTDERQTELLDRIESSWRSQGELIQGIADVTRLDTGLLKPTLLHIDIAPVLDDVAAEFRVEATRRQVRFEVALEPVNTITDPTLLARIVRNLLSNAFKFTPAGGAVALRCCARDDTALIQVCDSGKGIDANDQEKIFDEYVQLDGSGSQKGLGLGLAIVHRLVQLLNLEVSLNSTRGVGTTFTVTLKRESKPIHMELSGPVPEASTAPVVFVVDDERDIRDGMQAMLEATGCKVVCSASPRGALQRIGSLSAPPVLLVVDYRLGEDTNGLELIDRLRDEINEPVPAILMTGTVFSSAALADHENITLMSKPVEPAELQKQIIHATA